MSDLLSTSEDEDNSNPDILYLRAKIKERKPNKRTVPIDFYLTPSKKCKFTNELQIFYKFQGQSEGGTQGTRWNVSIVSWSVNGIRSLVQKKYFNFLKEKNADIICLQNTRCPDQNLPEAVNLHGYYSYWMDSEQAGYAGVGLYSKKEPGRVTKGIGIREHDTEGRVITAEYRNVYVVNAYVPNAGVKLKTLSKRLKWDRHFHNYLDKLNQHKPVILCGNMNVAHESIDLARPDSNKGTAGFTDEEREGFSDLLDRGFTDAFRYLYPNARDAYTFWSFHSNARSRNVGWRLDYFVLSNSLLPKLHDCIIHSNILGSFHCPISLYLNL